MRRLDRAPDRRITPAILFLTLALPQPGSAQLGLSDAQLWHAATPGLTTSVEAGSHFGRALASGDFDGDGFDDLAVGLPRVSVGGDSTAGAVLVLYGGVAGPLAAGHQVWTQDGFGADPAEPDDFFGWTLAAGDFDSDGFDDLAVGVPLEDLGSFESAGIVQVLHGGASGLAAIDAQTWSQDSPNVPDLAEPEDGFGGALAVADANQDGFDDLAIGVSGEDREGSPTHMTLGGVQVLFGSAVGLLVGDPTFLQPDGDVVAVEPQDDVAFGAALAFCRSDPESTPALVVGMPELAVGGDLSAGGVAALTGIGGETLTLFAMSQDSAGVPGAAEPGDRFGLAVACGDFDADGIDEIAVGAPFEAIGALAGAGAINLLETGLTPVHGLVYEDLLVAESSESQELFGWALAVGDFDADGADDLAIGAPGELAGGLAVGAGFLLYGDAATGLDSTAHQRLTQAVDPPEADDRFGSALAAGRFAGRAAADLAVGAPFEALDGQAEIGAVNLFFAFGLFRDGFETGDASAWSAVTP